MIKKVITIMLGGLLATTITAYGFTRNFHQGFAHNRAMGRVNVLKFNAATTTDAAIKMFKVYLMGSTTSATITVDPDKNTAAITTGAAIITTGPAIKMFKVCRVHSTTSSAITTGAGIDVQNSNNQTTVCIKIKKKSKKKCFHNNDKKGHGRDKQITKNEEKDDNNQGYDNNDENDHNNDNFKIIFSGYKENHHKQGHEKANKHSRHSNDNNDENNND